MDTVIILPIITHLHRILALLLIISFKLKSKIQYLMIIEQRTSSWPSKEDWLKGELGSCQDEGVALVLGSHL